MSDRFVGPAYSSELRGILVVADPENPYAHKRPITSMGSIVVQPPVHIGEGFEDAILGLHRHGVSVREVMSNSEMTVLVATTERRNLDHLQDLRNITQRIGKLVNTPDVAPEMMNEAPFPPVAE